MLELHPRFARQLSDGRNCGSTTAMLGAVTPARLGPARQSCGTEAVSDVNDCHAAAGTVAPVQASIRTTFATAEPDVAASSPGLDSARNAPNPPRRTPGGRAAST